VGKALVGWEGIEFGVISWHVQKEGEGEGDG
jgi:hypothetical protein